MSNRAHLLTIAATLTFAGLEAAALNATPAQSKRSRSDSDINLIGKRTLTKDVNFFSIQQEKEIGRKQAQAKEQDSKMVDDPVVTDYLNRIIQNLARSSDARMPITVRIIDSNAVEATTLPGGFLFVSRGLILQTESEAELAGVLARGIAHTALRTATRAATKGAIVAMVLSMPQVSISPGCQYPQDKGPACNSPFGMVTRSPQTPPANLQSVTSFLTLNFLRGSELDADYFGLQYMYKAGYNPEPFIRSVERDASTIPSGVPVSKVFSAYPTAADRVQAMRQECVAILPHRDGARDSSPEFETVKERLRNPAPK